MKSCIRVSILISVLATCYVPMVSGQTETQDPEQRKKALNLIYTLERKEPYYSNVYDLHAEFKNAYQDFIRYHWPDPDNYIELSYRWYNLIVNMYDKFSGPQIQEIRERYEDGILATQCRAGTRYIMEGTDTLYLQEYNPDIIHDPDYTYINGRRIDGVKTEAMCDLFKITLAKPQLKVTTPTPGTLRIYGDYVRARDLTALFKQSDNISALEIYALNRFIVDDNLEIRTDKQFPMFIVSPIWDILTADEIPEEARKPYQNNAWPPTIHIASTVSGSSFFGIGMQFLQMEGHLGITISRPRSSGYVTLYQLVPPEEVKVARTAFGLAFKEPNPAIVDMDYHEAMNEYAKYLLQSRNDPFRNTLLTEFFIKIYTYPNFKASLFNTLGFAHELEILEDNFLSLYRDNIPVQAIYRTLKDRFREYSLKPRNNDNDLVHVEMRKSVNTAIFSKMDVLTSDDVLVLDLAEYIGSSLSDAINLGDVVQREKAKKIMMYNQDLKDSIIEEMVRIKGYIENTIMPYMNLTNIEIDDQMGKILELIMNLKEKTKRNMEERKKQQSQLKQVQGLKLFYSILAAIGGALLALGTLGGGGYIFIGGYMILASTIINSEPDPTVTDKLQMPAAMDNVQYFVESKTHSLDNFLEILDDNEPQLLGDLKNNINGIRQKLVDGSAYAPFEEVEVFLSQKEHELKSMSPPPSAALDVINKLKKNLEVAQVSSADTYLKYYRNDTALKILSDAADSNDPEEIRKINEYERNVHSLLVPAIKYLMNYTMSVTNMANSQSLADIDMTRYKANNVIEDIRFRVSEFTEGWHEGKMMLHLVDKLKRALNLVFGLLSKIAAYFEYIELINYMANISAIEYDTNPVGNTEMRDVIDNVKYIARYNMAIAHYKKVLNSYRLFAFPFTTMLDAVDNFDFSSERKIMPTTKEIAYNAELQLSYLNMKMNTYKNDIIRRQDVNLMEANFDGSSSRQPVFFSWNLRNSASVLEKLFGGEQVKLVADIKEGPNRNAIKFKRIGIRIKSKKPKGQAQVNNGLRSYNVRMTHSGESHFRCGDQFYRTRNANLTFVYSYETNESGEPKTAGLSYKKLIKSDPLLSPYTEWTINLETESNDFSALQDLKTKRLDLELVGVGQYISGSLVCDKHLDMYYEKLD